MCKLCGFSQSRLHMSISRKFLVFTDALVQYEGTNRSITTAGIWATYPQPHVHNITGFFDQVFKIYKHVATHTCIQVITCNHSNFP